MTTVRLTEFRRRQLKQMVADTQDGKLKGKNAINTIILDSFERADDTDDIQRDLEYAIHELTKALTVIKNL